MVAQPDPYVAFLSSIQDAFAASGGSPNAFTPGVQGIPSGVPGTPGDPGGGVAGGVAPAGVGAGGASVPGTATTGQGILESIVAGGDPDVARRLLPGSLFQTAPGEPGDLGAGVTGGNVNALLSVLGGPLAIPTILGSLVASDAMGLPPDPGLLSVPSLAQIAAVGDPANRLAPVIDTTITATPVPSGGFGGVTRARQESEIDRGRTSTPSAPGRESVAPGTELI